MNLFSSFSTAAAFLYMVAFAPSEARAQGGPAAGKEYAAVTLRNDPRPVAAAEAEEELVLTGKITNPAGVLPGAVVILTASKQMAVTNADGEFHFAVPANAGPLRARVTYAGFADELMTLNDGAASTVNLANATVIVVARKQRLKAYLKTARKQVRRSLRQLHN